MAERGEPLQRHANARAVGPHCLATERPANGRSGQNTSIRRFRRFPSASRPKVLAMSAVSGREGASRVHTSASKGGAAARERGDWRASAPAPDRNALMATRGPCALKCNDPHADVNKPQRRFIRGALARWRASECPATGSDAFAYWCRQTYRVRSSAPLTTPHNPFGSLRADGSTRCPSSGDVGIACHLPPAPCARRFFPFTFSSSPLAARRIPHTPSVLMRLRSTFSRFHLFSRFRSSIRARRKRMSDSPEAATKAASEAAKVATSAKSPLASPASTDLAAIAADESHSKPSQQNSISTTTPSSDPATETNRDSFAEPSNSASRTPSSDSDDGDTIVDEPPSKQPISPVSAASGQNPTPPLDIIHSVANTSSVPPLSPVSDSTTPTPRTGVFSIFSPRNGKSTSPLRRLFSPRWFIDESLPDYDYVEHIKNLEPTYEPEPPLLPTPSQHAEGRICLVLDLDETLVHSSFTPLPNADFEIPLDMQGEIHTVYVKKRPGVDNFLKKASEWFEIVIFTASLALYANPVVDLLDPHNLVELRLYREHCVLIGGCYVKDIAKLGRDLKRTVIIDNSPLSYVLQPENAIPISAFFTDDNDRELDKTLALLEQARKLDDVRKALT
ncbi:NLI interacting factor-like phosphatase [Gracilaria domingensis]|nr:NLI interacting factor-like phosphatase [Gracilaria domingensis]